MNNLIELLIRQGYLKTPRIIEAFEQIDRRDFVPEDLRIQAYVNAPLPIGYGQTISQPLTVAFMLELLQPKPGNKVLDIGSGSGWQTALLAYCVGVPLKYKIQDTKYKLPVHQGRIYAIERIPELCEFGCRNVKKYFENVAICKRPPALNQSKSFGLGLARKPANLQVKITFFCGDGSQGWPAQVSFDKIIAAASVPKVPLAWTSQLKVGGSLVFPMKGSLWHYVKKTQDKIEKKEYPGFVFVPLLSDTLLS